MSLNHLPLLIITGRPAAGKSEIIDFLKNLDPAERLRRFHIGPFVELDDFLYVWETFEIDDILSRYGRKRVFTDERYFFKEHFVWNLFVERINLAYRKLLAKTPGFHDSGTTLVEFARGGKNGIEEALGYLSDDILARAGLNYSRVSYEESVRKNKRRARKGMEDSILYQSLPDEKMEFYYRFDDWDKLERMDAACITVKGRKVPYAVFENEPERTLDRELIGKELERVTTRLWEAMKDR